jgi:hypothetical protein
MAQMLLFGFKHLLKISIMKNEKTSARVASEASDILRDKHETAQEKSVAGSALTQAPDHNKKSEHHEHHGHHHHHNKKSTC